MVDVVAGIALIAGGVLAAGAAVARRGGRPAAAALATGLVLTGIARLLDGPAVDEFEIAACAVAVAGLALLVLAGFQSVSRLSWLDAAMGASATAALAVSLGAPVRTAVAAGGAVGALALCRWRPGRMLLLAIAGVGALADGAAPAVVAAPALAGAAWRRDAPAGPGPEFSLVVLSAILTSATVALTLLTMGQFADVSDAAVALATLTVLAGMARAGLTVVERLRESDRRAVTDDLTGLGNRRHLVERLNVAIESAASTGEVLALLLIDLDGFKELNDTLGHHAGDEVLRQIGPRLSHILRADDILARLGGDEFAVVLAPGDEATASAAGLRLRAALERPFEVGGIRVHTSMPASASHSSPSTPATLTACSSAPTSRCTRPSGCGPVTRSTCGHATATAASGCGSSVSCMGRSRPVSLSCTTNRRRGNRDA